MDPLIILGKKYTVSRIAHRAGVRGQVDYWNRRIEVDDDPASLLHEIIHAYAHELGEDVSERVVELIALCASDFLLGNRHR